METETKKVKVEIMSSNGHDTLLLEPSMALDRVRTEVETNGKWCYCDGKFTKVENLTATELANTEVVTLTNSLIGG